nr:MAG TPA: hypothetical protein [Caudoviricetes sp.]DAX14287.1 MAG TPA: hypothetical protein [Bacteriophage sp.]
MPTRRLITRGKSAYRRPKRMLSAHAFLQRF